MSKAEHVGNDGFLQRDGTVISDEIVLFLQKYHFSVLWSMDGPKRVQNMHRRFALDGKGSFDKVYSNLKYIFDFFPEYYQTIEINAVVSTDRDYFDAMDFFNNDPILQSLTVHMNHISSDLLTESYAETVEYQCARKTQRLQDLLDYIQGRYSTVHMREDSTPDSVAASFQKESPLPKKFHHNGPCIPGYENLFVDIYGRFFPCINASEYSKAVCFGNLWDGFDRMKIEAMMNLGKLTEEDCKKCVSMRFCSICPLMVDNREELSAEIKQNYCTRQKMRLDSMLKKYVIFRETGVI